MLTSITPLGERSRHQNYVVTSVAFVIGSLAGGLVLAVLAFGLGSLITGAASLQGAALAGAVAVATLICVVVAEPLVRRPLGLQRQVNERWLDHFRGWVYGAGFGFQLGTGVATLVTTPMVFVVVAAIALSPSLAVAAGIGACFAACRALSLLPGAWVTSPGRLALLSRRISTLEGPAHRAAVLLGAAGATFTGIYLTLT